MPKIDVRIKNIKEIQRAFGIAPRLMVRELNNAIRMSLGKIEQESRVRTPVDTGRLYSSHYQNFSNLRGEVGTNTEYDLFVHEGTKFMRARPYLRNAVSSSNSQIQMYFTNAVDKVLTEIGRQT